MYLNLLILAGLLVCNIDMACAEVQIYVKEYTYQASELDSKSTARHHALTEVKKLVLNEIGVAVFSETRITNNTLENDQIISLSGGFVSSEVMDEKWDGNTYWIKAKLSADPEDTKKIVEILSKRLSASKELEANRKTITKLQSQIKDLHKSKISLVEKRKSYEEIISKIALAADQFIVGVTFATEAKDYVSAFNWYLRAAINGLSWAQYAVGILFHEGRGVERDEKKSVFWLKKAADQNFMLAIYTLGVNYYHGRGVEKSYEKAFEYYSIAAANGVIKAQNNLGNLLLEGEGVRQNKEMAIYWYRKAAEQGHATSQYNLALMYWRGNGIAKDKTESFRLMKLAAEGGHKNAQAILGTIYAKGDHGGPPDYIYAYSWYTVAIRNGSTEANYDRNILIPFMKAKDIEIAQKIADTISSTILTEREDEQFF
jgi:TPR repeat protein